MTTTAGSDLHASFDSYESSWASQRWDRWQATLSPCYRFSIDGVDVGGVDETLAWSRALFTAFPDYRQRIERIVVDGTTSSSRPSPTGRPPERPAGRHPAPPSLREDILRFGPEGLEDDRQYHDGLDVARRIWPALGSVTS